MQSCKAYRVIMNLSVRCLHRCFFNLITTFAIQQRGMDRYKSEVFGLLWAADCISGSCWSSTLRGNKSWSSRGLLVKTDCRVGLSVWSRYGIEHAITRLSISHNEMLGRWRYKLYSETSRNQMSSVGKGTAEGNEKLDRKAFKKVYLFNKCLQLLSIHQLLHYDCAWTSGLLSRPHRVCIVLVLLQDTASLRPGAASKLLRRHIWPVECRRTIAV